MEAAGDSTELLTEAEGLRVAIGGFVRRFRHSDGLPGGQAAVLGHLARCGALTITELAEREHVRHQSMARTVSLLKEHGLITAIPDAADRRQVIVRISDRGRTLLQADRRGRAGAIARAIESQLSAAERDQLRNLTALLTRLSGSGG